MQTINNLSSITLSTLSNTGTTVVLGAQAAQRIAAHAPSETNPVVLTLVSSGNVEIVHCIAADTGTDTLTLIRGREQTAAVEHQAGATIEARVTRDLVDQYNPDNILTADGEILVDADGHVITQ